MSFSGNGHAETAAEKLRRPPAAVFVAVRGHDFHPVGADAFTIDRHLKVHGIADLGDID